MSSSYGRYDGPERRKYLRLDANCVVSYKRKQFVELFNMSQTQNVSQGGAIITTDKPFDKGMQLSIMIKFPFLTENLKITGEVVDSKEIVKDNIYETRVKFLDLPPECFYKMGEFIELKKRKR